MGDVVKCRTGDVVATWLKRASATCWVSEARRSRMAKRKRRKDWPPWWDWELKLLDHLYKRMGRREFTAIALRRMMEHATGYRPDVVKGRWVIETRHERKPWEVVVEPIEEIARLVVITAYDVWDD